MIKGDLARYLSGMPVMVAGANIAISQPSIKDICAFGEDEFFEGLSLFVKAKNLVEKIKLDNSQLAMLSDFQVLLVIFREDKEAKKMVDNLFSLILPDYTYKYDAGCIQFYVDDKSGIVGQLNPMNFDNFKMILSELFLPGSSKDDEPDFNPSSDKAAEIAKKLEEGRRKRAAIKAKESGEDKIKSIFANYLSVLSIGLSMDINILYMYTPFQLYDAFRRYTAKSSYDLYQRVSTMPMVDTNEIEEPDNWIGNIYK